MLGLVGAARITSGTFVMILMYNRCQRKKY